MRHDSRRRRAGRSEQRRRDGEDQLAHGVRGDLGTSRDKRSTSPGDLQPSARARSTASTRRRAVRGTSHDVDGPVPDKGGYRCSRPAQGPLLKTVLELLGEAYSHDRDDLPVDERRLPKTQLATLVRALFLQVRSRPLMRSQRSAVAVDALAATGLGWATTSWCPARDSGRRAARLRRQPERARSA